MERERGDSFDGFTSLTFRASAVLAGYVAALLAAAAAVHFRVLYTPQSGAEASAGMYLLGDALLFAAVFGLVALFPTGLALHYLRPHPRFWTGLSIASLALAVSGPAAALVAALSMSRQLSDHFWGIAVPLAFLRTFFAPLLATLWLIAGFIAPAQRSRRALFVAAAIEGVAAASAALWLASQLLLQS